MSASHLLLGACFLAPVCSSAATPVSFSEDSLPECSRVLVVGSELQSPSRAAQQLQCHLFPKKGTVCDDDPTAESRSCCCRAINHAMTEMKDLAEEEIFHRCSEELVKVKIMSTEIAEAEDISLLLPDWLWSPFESRESMVPVDSTWRHWLWDNEMRNVVRIEETGEIADPNATIVSDDIKVFLNKIESSWHNEAPIHFSLSSEMSPSGGMHRRFHHKLHVAERATSGRGFAKTHFSVWILLQIPAGLFINVEDAFEVGYADQHFEGVNIRLVTDSKVLIDQEEPAFVSPSHAVIYHVTGSLNVLSTEKTHDFQWDTLVHVRYPAPALGNHVDGPKDDVSCIIAMPPTIIAASTGAANGLPRIYYAGVMPVSLPSQLCVATGRASDLFHVLATTYALALLGTAWVLREIVHALSSE